MAQRHIKHRVIERDVWGQKHLAAYAKALKGTIVMDNYDSVQIYLDTLPLKPVDRNRIDPMTRGYIDRALRDLPFHTFEDIDNQTVRQMSGDCVQFYWGSRYTFENIWADPWTEYSQRQAGREFWLSRHKSEKGFIRHYDPFEVDGPTELWGQLHEIAGKLGPYVLVERSNGKLRGQNET